jgi:cytochrome c553
MKSILLLALPLLLIGCNQKKEDYKTPEKKVVVNDYQESKKLIETHCYVCHSPNAPEQEGRIAPPMVAIKAHYMSEGVTKEEFIAAVKSFVEKPSEDKVHLKGAFKRFGLMPKQVFPEGSIEKIAKFMYDYQIEEPTWFKDHWKERGFGNWTQSGKKIAENNKPKTIDEIGLEYALSTKKVLGKNLMGAIQKKGTLAALEFCNIKAIPLIDSMSTKHNAIIKRVSDRNRNPNNKANTEELKYIAQFKTELAAKKEIKPVVIEKGNKIQFYYPIETNTMCLQCHGTQIKPDVHKQILKLYPKDLAVGYSENQLRGIWSITFDKKKP